MQSLRSLGLPSSRRHVSSLALSIHFFHSNAEKGIKTIYLKFLRVKNLPTKFHFRVIFGEKHFQRRDLCHHLV